MKFLITESQYRRILKESQLPQITNREIVDLVIDKLEGGYYDPAKHKKAAMLDSGETMFGMDRKHGDFERSSEGKQFWSLIDAEKEKNPEKWVHYYKLDDDPDLAKKLKDLIHTGYVEAKFNDWSSKFNLNPELKRIIEGDPRLKFHMYYALWNGPGWFKKYAKALNDAYMRGMTDTTDLFRVGMGSRLNSGNKLIARSGKKIQDIFNDTKSLDTYAKTAKSGNNVV